MEPVEGPILDVTEEEEEVGRAITSMKANKAPGPSGLSRDVLRAAGEPVVKKMTKVFQDIMRTEECPEEGTGSTAVPIFKGKGDPLQCGKYRGLRLLYHGAKIWEIILYRRLKENVVINDNQFGFAAGKSTTDATYVMRNIQQRYCKKKKKLYHVFVDLVKAFDRVPRGAVQ